MEQIRLVPLSRFIREDREACPEDYKQREQEYEDSDNGSSSESEGDSSASEHDSQARRKSEGRTNLAEELEREDGESALQNMREPAWKRIENRLDEFKQFIFGEENIISTLRFMYGPKSLCSLSSCCSQ